MKTNTSSPRRPRMKSLDLGSVRLERSPGCLTQIMDSDTLLTYALVTTPTPVHVSAESGPPAIATVTLVVSCPPTLAQVKVTQIAITIPIANPAAPDSGDLALTATGIGHSVSSSDKDQWTNEPGAAAGTFLIKPKTGESGIIIKQGLTLSFPGIQVSGIVGTAWIKVAETATSDTTPAQLRRSSIAVPKFPAGFFAGNFTAAKPAVLNGQSAVLSWAGSPDAIYTLFWGSSSEVVTNVRSWKSPALTETTSFMLSVSAQEGGQTVVLYFSVSVEVLNPDIVAKSVTVNGPVSVDGTALIGGAATFKNAVTANGAAYLPGGVAVGTAFTANPLANLLGGANVRGPFIAAGSVNTFGSIQTVGPGNYQALTDGLVIGTVTPSGSNLRFDVTISGSSAGVTVYATGGGTLKAVRQMDPPYYGVTTSGSFLLPVKFGQPWSVQINPPYFSMPMPQCKFYWIPLGTGAAAPIRRQKQLARKSKKTKTPAALPYSRRWFSGHAKLVKGRATVRFSGAVGARRRVKNGESYVVQLTPLGECRGLAIARKAGDRFEVIELGGGRAAIAFDWTISFPPADDASE